MTPVSHDTPGQPSARTRLRFLLGDRPTLITTLVLVSVLAGLMESAILTAVAQAAAALVDGVRRVHVSVGPLHLTATLALLLAAALAFAVVRLALMVPVSVLPARIGADVQARLRLNLFSAFTHASWTVQSRDREGHLQELMTNQVAQATGAAASGRPMPYGRAHTSCSRAFGAGSEPAWRSVRCSGGPSPLWAAKTPQRTRGSSRASPFPGSNAVRERRRRGNKACRGNLRFRGRHCSASPHRRRGRIRRKISFSAHK